MRKASCTSLLSYRVHNSYCHGYKEIFFSRLVWYLWEPFPGLMPAHNSQEYNVHELSDVKSGQKVPLHNLCIKYGTSFETVLVGMASPPHLSVSIHAIATYAPHPPRRQNPRAWRFSASKLLQPPSQTHLVIKIRELFVSFHSFATYAPHPPHHQNP